MKFKVNYRALGRLLFPPDPIGPASAPYGDLIGSLLPYLEGQATQTGTPSVPGIIAAPALPTGR